MVKENRQDDGEVFDHHQALSMIMEEVAEYQSQVWKKDAKKDLENMAEELMHIAARAIQTAEDLLKDELKELE